MASDGDAQTARDRIDALQQLTHDPVTLIRTIAGLGAAFPLLSSEICDQLPDRINVSASGMSSALLSLLESGIPYDAIIPRIDRSHLLSRASCDPDAKRALFLSLSASEPVPAVHPESIWRLGAGDDQQAGPGPVSLSPSAPLVVLDHLARSLASLQSVYDAALPALVTGPGACGKSSLIDAFIATLPNASLIRLFIDSGTDLKSLIGTYSCTEVAGQFRWVPGPITLAVLNGLNVVIEDLDRVPIDLLQSLRSLLEGRWLTIPEQGRTLLAHPNFRLLATSSSPAAESLLVRSLFAQIHLPPLSLADLRYLLTGRFASLSPHLPLILQTYAAARDANGAVDVRALLRLCRRLDRMQLAQRLNSGVRERILEHVHVCLVMSMIPSPGDAQFHLSQDIARIWNIDDQRRHYILHELIPEQALRTPSLAPTAFARRLLSRLSAAVEHDDPVLLVGETGNGKTAIVEELALQCGRRLVVLNLSQQTDPQDLIGGFKPVDLRSGAIRILNDFASLFPRTFSRSSNVSFLQSVRKAFDQGRYGSMAGMLGSCCDLALARESRHRKQWVQLQDDVAGYRGQVRHRDSGTLSFGFVEGALVQAVRRGDWVLLDEINLASPDALHCLSALLESSTSSITLFEHGSQPVPRHAHFRLFACMNPPTDSCRRPLRPEFRRRFLELFVDDVTESADLLAILRHTLPALPRSINSDGVIRAYFATRQMSVSHQLSSDADTGQRPTYSLRSLCRALRYAQEMHGVLGLERALYEGLYMSFMTPLDARSRAVVAPMFDALFTKRRSTASLAGRSDDVEICGFPLRRGPNPIPDAATDDFIVTDTVSGRLRDLARILSGATPLPVLLQGPTSAGKTSLIEYLARRTGQHLVRINNHEHTDTSEYLGTYSTDAETGRLRFIEGALVRAVRHGHWLVLDELNLAPSEVLEALNRLLDDHRQLYIAETQETVTAHPSFALFGTQNPAGSVYGGRKVLSRAFRNRFVEIHVGEIPIQELAILLERRGRMAPSHCTKIIQVMTDLQRRRQQSRVFAGKSLITARDLFRWALRRPVTMDDIAGHGYMLLADRLRSRQDRHAVRLSLISNLKVKDVDPDSVYARHVPAHLNLSHLQIALTSGMTRMLALCHAGLSAKEPILLVGDTGLGKTTVCQILAQAAGRHLHIVNVHEHTDSSDLIGGLRPVRGRQHLLAEARQALGRAGVEPIDGDVLDAGVLDRIVGDSAEAEAARVAIRQLNSLFAWSDGPLVKAMKDGDWILIDEISLADDAVIERLNSVLELGRSLLLAENSNADTIVAADSFRIMATMNPSGDFGKKELSPALRNRFTEIWVMPDQSVPDLQLIIADLASDSQLFDDVCRRAIFTFYTRYHDECVQGQRDHLSIRDLKSLIAFIRCARQRCRMSISASFMHGVLLTVIDGLGIGTQSVSLQRRRLALRIALAAINDDSFGARIDFDDCCVSMDGDFVVNEDRFGLDPFWVELGRAASRPSSLSLSAPSTRRNLIRVLRGLQLRKPVLMEGSPGVGKTSLVSSLARCAGHVLARVNLSEQTDMMDLLGSDLPDPDRGPGHFRWRPGPVLQAIIHGHWVLLDELNLASQTVLEGLNALLDHRATVFIPELSESFTCHGSFRVFACQNPVHEGGGRKSLPASFLNRFTKVHLEEMTRRDLDVIVHEFHPDADPRLIDFNQAVQDAVCGGGVGPSDGARLGQIGAPFEFNLRDVFRRASTAADVPDLGLDLVYLQRFRTSRDRDQIAALYQRVFDSDPVRITHVLIDTDPGDVALTFSDPAAGLVRQYRPPGPLLREDRALLVLQGHSAPLLHLSEAVRYNMPVVVAGPSGSGKTSVVQVLAQLHQRRLRVLPVTTTLDASELLGSFQQVDLDRHHRQLCDAAGDGVRHAAAHHRLTASTLSLWDALQSRLRHGTICSPDSLALLAQINTDLGLGLNHDLDQLRDLICHGTSGRFEWVDGVVVRAIKQGDWLLLDNVNLACNSVLDRLNSLLEPDRVLILNENGVGDRIVAHPDFRLFLTADDQYGCLSRAIRNRCVEISLINDADAGAHRQWRHRYTDDDIIRLLIKSGVTSSSIATVMLHIHVHIAAQHHQHVHLHTLLHWARLATAHVARHAERPVPALTAALRQAYHDMIGDDIMDEFYGAIASIRDGLILSPWTGSLRPAIVHRLTDLIRFWTSPQSALKQWTWTSNWLPRFHNPNRTIPISVVVQYCPRRDFPRLQHVHELLLRLVSEQLPVYGLWAEFMGSATAPWTSIRAWAGTPCSVDAPRRRLILLVDRLLMAGRDGVADLVRYRGGRGPDPVLITTTISSIDRDLLQNMDVDPILIAQCWRLRDRLVRAVAPLTQWTEYDLAALYIRCRDLDQLLLTSPDSCARDTRDCLQRLGRDACSGSSTPFTTNRLWKRSGRVRLPTCHQLADLRARILHHDRNTSSDQHFTSPRLRRTLTEALSTCYAFDDVADGLDSVSQAVSLVIQSDTCQGVSATTANSFTIRISDTGDLDAAVIEEIEIDPPALNPDLHRSCAQIVNAYLLRTESALLAGWYGPGVASPMASAAVDVAVQFPCRSCYDLEPLQTITWSRDIDIESRHRLERAHLRCQLQSATDTTTTLLDAVRDADQTPIRRRQQYIEKLKRLDQLHWKLNAHHGHVHRQSETIGDVTAALLALVAVYRPRIRTLDQISDVYQSDDERFLQVVNWFLTPLLEAIKVGSVWSAWLLIRAMRLHLLGPKSAVDPALKYEIRAGDAAHDLDVIVGRLDLHEIVYRYMAGADPDQGQYPDLVQHQQCVQNELRRARSRLIIRHEPDRFPIIYDRIQLMLTTLASPERVRSMIGDNVDTAIVRDWLTFAESFVHDTMATSVYHSYEDVCAPVLVELMHMCVLLRHAPSSSNRRLDHVSRQIVTLYDRPDLDLARVCAGPGLTLPAIKVVMHQLSLFNRSRSRSAHYRSVLSTLVRLWDHIQERRRLQADDAARIYRYKPSSAGAGHTDQERRQRLYQDLFPSCQDDVADLVPDHDKEHPFAHDDPEQQQQQQEGFKHDLDDDDLLDIFQLYCQSQTTSAALYLDLDAGRVRQRAVLTLLLDEQAEEDRDPDVDRALFLTCSNLIQYEICHLTSTDSSSTRPPSSPAPIPPGPSTSSQWTFALSPAPAPQLESLQVAIAALLRRLRAVLALEECAGHPTLIACARLCSRLMSMPLITSLHRLCACTEQILSQANHWEQYAAKYVSLQADLTPIWALVVRWRKMELDCWRHTLTGRDWAQFRAAIRLWPHLIQLVLAYDNLDADQVLSVLDEFLHTSPCGQVAARLRMMESLGEISGGPVRHLVGNLSAYYTLIVERCVQLHVAQGRKQIEADLVKLCRLVRWDVGNYHAVKQSCQKSHDHIVQLVHRYDSLLDEGVAPFLLQDRNRFAKPDLDWTEIGATLDERDHVAVLSAPSPSRRLARNLLHLVLRAVPDWRPITHHIRLQTEQIVDRARSLRHENGSLLRKKKALVDTMRVMRESGALSYHQSVIRAASPHTDTGSLAAVFSTAPVSCGSESQFLELVELMRCLRSSIGAHHADLTSVESHRALSLLEHVFAVLVHTRHVMAAIADGLDRFAIFATATRVASGALRADRIDVERLRCVQDRVVLALSQIAELRVPHSDDERIGECVRLLDVVRRERDELEVVPVDGLWTVVEVELVQRCTSTLAVVDDVLAHLPFSSCLANIARHLHEYVSDPTYTTRAPAPKSAHDLIQAVKLSGQRLHRCRAHPQPDSDASPSSAWIDVYNDLLRMNRSLHLSCVLQQMQQADWATFDPDHVADLCESAQVLHHAQRSVYDALYDFYAAFITLATCSATILNTVFRQGFCRPRQDEKDGDTGDAADGTGMGEGVGQKDVSDQIADEDQLLGLEGDERVDNDHVNDSVPEDAAGMEMENEFQGDFHNVDRDEQEDPDDDADDADLDARMSDTDVNDDEAVDERLWDQDLDQEAEQDQDQMKTGAQQQPNEIGARQDHDERASPDRSHEPNMSRKPDPEQDEDEDESVAGGDNADQNQQEEDETPSADLDTDIVDHPDQNLKLPQDLNLDDQMDCEDVDDDQKDADTDGDGSGMDQGDDVDADDTGADARLPSQPEDDITQMDDEVDHEPDLEQDETMEPEGDDIHVHSSEPRDAGIDAAEVAEGGANTQSNQTQDDMMPSDTDMGGDQSASNVISDDNDQGQLRPDSAPSHKDGADRERQQPRKCPESQRNPLRSLADAHEHWRRKCEVLEEAVAVDEDREAISDPDDHATGDVSDLAQHVSEQMEADGAALAASTDRIQVDDDPDEERTQEDYEPFAQTSRPKNDDDDCDAHASDDEQTPDQVAPIKRSQRRRAQQQTSLSQDDADQPAAEDDHDCEIRNDADRSSKQMSELMRPTTAPTDAPDHADRPDSGPDPEHHRGALALCPDPDEARWQQLCASTSDLSAALCEQLRIMLLPQIASNLGGAFRSGKRLSIRRVISYIASSFRHDRIWLRRCRPSRRSYDIAIAIDNSLSMRETGADALALQSLTILATALNRLDAGNLAVFKFGASVDLLSQSFTLADGARVTSSFSFSDSETSFTDLLERGLDHFDQARVASSIDLHHNQLMIIISDARIQQDRTNIARLLRRAAANDQFVVLVVIDSSDDAASIVNMKTVSYPNGRLQVDDYLTDFPFPFYIILRRAVDLPPVIADALRQWVELVQRA